MSKQTSMNQARMSHLIKCNDLRGRLEKEIRRGRVDRLQEYVGDMRTNDCGITYYSIVKAIADSPNWDLILTIVDLAPEIVPLLIATFKSRGEVRKALMIRTHISSS